MFVALIQTFGSDEYDSVTNPLVYWTTKLIEDLMEQHTLKNVKNVWIPTFTLT